MDDSDVLTAVLGGAATAVAGVLLLQFQLGGWRRRARRELVEELDLLAKLPAGDHKNRVQHRVNRLLDQYAPGPKPEKTEDQKRQNSFAWLFAVAVLGVTAVSVLLDLPAWVVPVAGGVLIGVVVWFVGDMGRREDAADAVGPVPDGDD